jgi:hypothetical protein
VSRQTESKLELAPAQPKFDPALVAEIIDRGITEKRAHELLANLKPGQDKNLIAQLEYAEQTVQQLQGTPNQVRNPAGFIITVIANNNHLPDGFETKAQAQARAERERKENERRATEEGRQLLEDEYERYCDNETDRYIAAHPDIYAALKEAKLQEENRWTTGLSLGTGERMATLSARWQIRNQAPLLAFQEFLERKKQGTDLFLKPVGPSPVPAATNEPAAEATSSVEVEASALPDDLLAAEERREAEMSKQIIAPEEPAIELVKAETEAVMPMAEYPVAEIEPEDHETDTVFAPQSEAAIESDKTNEPAGESAAPASVDSATPIAELLTSEPAAPSFEEQITDTFRDEEAAA